MREETVETEGEGMARLSVYQRTPSIQHPSRPYALIPSVLPSASIVSMNHRAQVRKVFDWRRRSSCTPKYS